MKTVLSLYKEYLDKELIRFDEKQNSILIKLSKIIPFNYGILSNLRNLFLGKEITHKGIYLWGKAGSGKTMIMDLCFFASNQKKKRRIHFLSTRRFRGNRNEHELVRLRKSWE